MLTSTSNIIYHLPKSPYLISILSLASRYPIVYDVITFPINAGFQYQILIGRIMSAQITIANVPNSLPVIELTIRHPSHTTTTYPDSINSALDSIQALGIIEIEYDEITDTRLIHDSIAA